MAHMIRPGEMDCGAYVDGFHEAISEIADRSGISGKIITYVATGRPPVLDEDAKTGIRSACAALEHGLERNRVAGAYWYVQGRAAAVHDVLRNL